MELCRHADTATYDWEQARGGRSGHLPGRVRGGCQLDSFKRRLKGTESGQDKRLLTSLPPPHTPQFNPFSSCLHPAVQPMKSQVPKHLLAAAAFRLLLATPGMGQVLSQCLLNEANDCGSCCVCTETCLGSPLATE